MYLWEMIQVLSHAKTVLNSSKLCARSTCLLVCRCEDSILVVDSIFGLLRVVPRLGNIRQAEKDFCFTIASVIALDSGASE